MLLFYGIPSRSELLLHPFPVLRAIRLVQILVMEFSKDWSADLCHDFPDGGAANQPVILQGCVGPSDGEVSHSHCKF